MKCWDKQSDFFLWQSHKCTRKHLVKKFGLKCLYAWINILKELLEKSAHVRTDTHNTIVMVQKVPSICQWLRFYDSPRGKGRRAKCICPCKADLQRTMSALPLGIKYTDKCSNGQIVQFAILCPFSHQLLLAKYCKNRVYKYKKISTFVNNRLFQYMF